MYVIRLRAPVSVSRYPVFCSPTESPFRCNRRSPRRSCPLYRNYVSFLFLNDRAHNLYLRSSCGAWAIFRGLKGTLARLLLGYLARKLNLWSRLLVRPSPYQAFSSTHMILSRLFVRHRLLLPSVLLFVPNECLPLMRWYISLKEAYGDRGGIICPSCRVKQSIVFVIMNIVKSFGVQWGVVLVFEPLGCARDLSSSSRSHVSFFVYI